jgi:hypothetical protein
VGLVLGAHQLGGDGFEHRGLGDRGVLGRPAGERVAEDARDVGVVHLVPPVDQQDPLLAGVRSSPSGLLSGLLDALKQRPGVLEVPVQHHDLPEALAQPVRHQAADHLLEHPPGQAHRAGEVPAAAAARARVRGVEQGRRDHQAPLRGHLRGDVLRDEAVGAERQVRAVLLDRAHRQQERRAVVDLRLDLGPGHAL